MPQTCVKMPSGLCECVWPPRMPPPQGVRIVTGAQKSPALRKRKRASSLKIWSQAG